MNHLRFSAQKFKNKDTLEFDPDLYSKFKFGCKSAARQFGTELAEKFLQSDAFRKMEEGLKQWEKERVIVLSSPYVHIPTATFAMKDYFIRTLNFHLVEKGLNPVLESKLYRKSSYKSDYGAMTKEERSKVLSDDKFYIDRNFTVGSWKLFLDDIIITGAHERRVLDALHHNEIWDDKNIFLYYAELMNPDEDPTIENYLNFHFVKNLVCLDKIIKNEEYLINTRMVKYILDAPHEECRRFCDYQKQVFLHTVYHYAIGNRYHKIPDFQANLQYIKGLIA